MSAAESAPKFTGKNEISDVDFAEQTKEKLPHMKSILWEDLENELDIAFLAA